jgi:DNA-binding CsgD family transcriptional regulator/tetratricopeptide (TPR) repeat protein
LRARALWGRGYLLTYAGAYESGISVTQQALDIAEAVGDDFTTARALDVLGTLQLFTDPVGSRPGLKRCIELARAAKDEWCVVDASQILAYSHLVCDEVAEGERLLDEALPSIERYGFGEQGAWYWLGMAYGPLVRGEAERFFELTERAISTAGEVGEPVTAAFAHAWTGQFEIAQGRPEAALARLKGSEAHVLASGGGMALPVTQTQLAGAHAALGQPENATVILEAVVASGVDGGYYLAGALVALADQLRTQDDAARAEERAQEALEISRRVSSPASSAASREVLGRLAAARGAWTEAEALLHEALAPRAELRLWLFVPQNLDALAEVAAGLNSHEEASRLLGAAERSRADLGLVRWPPDQPRFRVLAEALRTEMGEGPFEAAWAEGAAMPLDEAVAWIRRARGSRKRPLAGWEALTPTEAQVVELVSEGLTNAQIGERMFISRATVKVHLAHVFQKLDVKTRAELTAQAVRREARSRA